MPRQFYFLRIIEDLPKRIRQCKAMHLMASLLLLIYGLQYLLLEELSWIYVLALIPPPLLIIFMTIFKKNFVADPANNRIFRILEAGFLLMGSMHFLQNNQVVPALLFGFASLLTAGLLWMESRIFGEQFIDFSEEGVSIQLALQDKKIPWSQIHNILIRNHYLSIVFSDGQAQQYLIRNHYNDDELILFFSFCREKIEAA
ncbi:MAG: hypothetical protein JNJ58_10550 [Chitinophagaceae bacterium]|nr:hypothetical protein [Chitinophagaceae bacterium]